MREFVETQGRVPREEGQFPIARTQMEREDEAALRANRFLFRDTTPLMTALYSRWYWNRVDAVLSVLERRHDYALTLVTAPDSPWQEDGLQRESDEVRQTVHQQVLETLAVRGIDYFTVQGSLGERLLQVAELLSAISSARSMPDESR